MSMHSIFAPIAILPLSLVFFAAACSSPAQDTSCLDAPNGPTMRPGVNCLSCHRVGGAAGNKPWTAAGTVYEDADSPICDGIADVAVIFSDEAGTELTRLTSNEVGNFYTNFPLPEKFRVAVERDGRRREMPFAPPAGSCNACHAQPPIGDAQGRIRAP